MNRVQQPNILVALQEQMHAKGYVDTDDVTAIAEALNVSRAEVHGVLTFYSDLRTTPSAAISVRMCAAEACQARGSRDLLDTVRRTYERDADVEVSTVMCLGLCAMGPAALINEAPVARLTAPTVHERVEAARS